MAHQLVSSNMAFLLLVQTICNKADKVNVWQADIYIASSFYFILFCFILFYFIMFEHGSQLSHKPSACTALLFDKGQCDTACTKPA
jgi:ATP/ADP translocase